jgi:hypothetical protein
VTGDGTQIGRGLSVVNFAFTIIEEGGQAGSVKGNHTIAILKVSENYDDLAAEEAKDLEVVTVEDGVYKIVLPWGRLEISSLRVCNRGGYM